MSQPTPALIKPRPENAVGLRFRTKRVWLVMRVGNGGEEGGVNPWRRLDQREDGQRGDVFEVRAERLPFPGGFGPAFARGLFGGGGVINHAQRGVGLRILIAGGGGLWRGYPRNC